jgi:hypothetical protein
MQFLRAPRKLAGQGYKVGPCTGSAQECCRVSLENLRRSAGRGTLAQSVCSFGMLTIFRNPPEAYDPQKHKWVNVNSYEDILSWFQHHPYLKTSKPEPVTVGEVKGVQLETDVAKDSPEDAVKSFRYSDGFVASIDRGEQSRTIILDMKVEAVSIGVGFPRAQKVVDTVKWGGS